MLSFTCTNCSAEMSISRIGMLACPYCNSKKFFKDSELQEYRIFRKRMLEFISAAAQSEDKALYAERLWADSECVQFTDANGDDITIEYIYHNVEDGMTVYTARHNVIYHIPKEKAYCAQAMLRNIARLTYPQADMKGLSNCFPKQAGRFALKDGGILLVFEKSENFYPAAMFGELSAKHVEWIISRMENMACVLTYSELVHGGITPDAVFINPWTHEAALFGSWHKVQTAAPADVSDLKGIRDTARMLLGEGIQAAPEPVLEFINGKPAADAYEDFARWDEVIEKKLGGRHFTKFEL